MFVVALQYQNVQTLAYCTRIDKFYFIVSNDLDHRRAITAAERVTERQIPYLLNEQTRGCSSRSTPDGIPSHSLV